MTSTHSKRPMEPGGGVERRARKQRQEAEKVGEWDIKIGEGTLPIPGRGGGCSKWREAQQEEERFWCNLDTKSCS